MIWKNFIVIIFFLYTSCQFPKTENSKKIAVSNDWIKDKFGCLKLRTPELAGQLINIKNLMGGSKEDFLIVFGNPNKRIIDVDSEVLIYYFGGVCKNNVIVEDADKCWAEFYFNNDI